MNAQHSPLSTVLASIEQGAGSLDDIVTRTGLPAATVQAALDHLRRMGRLQARELAMGCPAGGCLSCAFAKSDGTPGCGVAPTPGPRRPVLVELTLRRAS